MRSLSARVRELRAVLAADEGIPSAAAPPSALAPEGGAGGGRRQIPKDYPYDPKALKPLARMLWAMSVSLGHALTAYRQFTRVKSASISPDGMVGGRGYVMPVDVVRKRLYEACEALSAVSDAIHDEINAPHWRPKLSDLGQNDAEDVHRLLDDASRILEDPEGEAEEELGDIEKENDGAGGSSNEVRWGDTPAGKREEEEASQMPGGGTAEMERNPPRPELVVKQASTLPVNTLPGPRVDTWDRGDQTGPAGSFNTGEEWSDDWQVDHAEHGETSWAPARAAQIDHQKWKAGDSALPTDRSPSDANDWGLGFGAEGKGVNYGPESPAMGPRGVYGPSSGLPRDPGGKTHDREHPTTTPMIEQSVAQPRRAHTVLPNDDKGPVSRADYYQGPKGGVELAESGLPGDSAAVYDSDADTPNTGFRHEHLDNPYVRRPSIPVPIPDPYFTRPRH